MREVALADAKNGLSALIQEVEETGEEIIITRHGKPAAKLSAVSPARTPEELQAIWDRLTANCEERARLYPETAKPLSWDELKADMEADRSWPR